MPHDVQSDVQSDVTLPQRCRLRPALSTLPPEIKAHIVEQLAQKELRSVSRINNEFAALAQPLLWHDINVTHYTQKRLAYLVNTILPRHNHLVKSLTLKQMDGPGGFRDAALRALVACRERDVAELSPRTIVDRRDLLLAQAIAAMRDLDKVRFVLYYLPPHLEDYWQDEGSREIIPDGRYPGGWIPLALAAVGGHLKDLSLVGDSQTRKLFFNGGRIASFLSHFPSLSTLSFNFHLPAEERNSFLSAVASLHHLRHLTVKGKHLFGDSLATTSWACPLDTLSMATRVPFPFSSLFTLLSRFSSTLTTLDLHMSKYARSPGVPSLLFTPFPTPRLHSLTLATEETSPSLTAFDHCPIECLTIGYCPKISPDEWEVFLTSHAETLKRVTVSARASLLEASEDVEVVRAFCDARRIAFVREGSPEHADTGSSDYSVTDSDWE